jgi:hypothetical protein
MQIERIAAKGQLVAYVFGQDALAASQSNVQLPAAVGEASQAVTGYTMPFAGEIVAITADLSSAGSAGSLTVGATIGGTEGADPTLSITTETTKSDVAQRGTAKFVAGDVLGAEITTDGSWNGTTADLAVVVYVLLEMAGI